MRSGSEFCLCMWQKVIREEGELHQLKEKESQGALVLSDGHHVHGNADAERAKTRRRAKRIKKNKGQQGALAG